MFSQLPEGSAINVGGESYAITYVAGAKNNNVVLSNSAALSIGNVSLPQATSGIADYVFTVSLSRPQSESVSVNYTTQDLTAIAGQDYLATQGTLTFAPGQTNQTLTVHVLGNSVPQATKSFAVLLSDPQNATLATAVGAGTIVGTATSTNLTDAGTDYWISAPFQDDAANPISASPTIQVMISSQQGAQGTISVAGIGLNQNWTVGVDGITVITLPLTSQVTTTDGVQDLGIHVVSNNNPVMVYLLSRMGYSTDGFVAIPTPASVPTIASCRMRTTASSPAHASRWLRRKTTPCWKSRRTATT